MPRTESLIGRTEIRNDHRKRFEEALNAHMVKNPQKPIIYRRLASETGITTEDARYLYSQFAAKKEVPPIKSRTLPLSQDEFDQKVDELVKQGLKNKAISERLLVYAVKVVEARSRNNRRKIEEREKLVRNSREKGLGNKEISRRTKMSTSTITTILGRLEKEDEKLRLRKPRASKDELAQRDAQVKQLRKQDLSRSQIAKKLKLNRYDVDNSLTRLLRAQEVQPKTTFV